MNFNTVDQVRELTAKAEAARAKAIEECQQNLARAADQRDKEILRAKDLYSRQAEEINALLAELGAPAKRTRSASGQTAPSGEKRRRVRKEPQI